MAGEVMSARESGTRPINAIGGQRREAPITFQNGYGGTRRMTLSEDAGKNEAMREVARKFTIDRSKSDATVDGYIRKASDGGYDVKVYGTTGQSWGSDKAYGSIVPLKNNPEYTLHLKKVGKRWQGTLTQRRYYGQGGLSTKLNF